MPTSLTTKCFCSSESVGYATNFIDTNYYCKAHWYGMASRVDKWLNSQYQKQWGNEQWFKELAVPKRKTGKQYKLL